MIKTETIIYICYKHLVHVSWTQCALGGLIRHDCQLKCEEGSHQNACHHPDKRNCSAVTGSWTVK